MLGRLLRCIGSPKSFLDRVWAYVFWEVNLGGGMPGILVAVAKSEYQAFGAIKWASMLLLALCELLIVSIRFDSGILVAGDGVSRFFAERLPLVPQLMAVVLAATLVFGGKELAECLARAGAIDRFRYLVPLIFCSHLTIFALFWFTSAYYFEVNRGASAIVFFAWGLLALATAASWLAVLVDPLIWVQAVKQLSGPVLIGSCVGSLAWLAGQWAMELWAGLAFATLGFVRLILTIARVEIVQDTSVHSIGTTDFSVTIAPECSGYEGMGLAVVFITTYLWWRREEHLFPRSFLLIPFAICLMFFVNALRIAALILVGHFGAKEIALGGFHSQAGWIGFNLVALGLVAFARTSPFFCKSEVLGSNITETRPTSRSVPMLAPFVLLTLSIMILGAVQLGFDWLYPIRFIVVAVVVSALWKQYPRDELRFGFHWIPMAIGTGVYLIWILLETSDGGVAKELFESTRALHPSVFSLWLVFRILGSVVTVPIAEEFAFRGYLMSWLAGERSARWSWFALIVSSIAFGVLHPGRWIAGTIAGLFYGIAYCRRGRVMDAVLAHATTNALIAAEAVLLSHWYLWG